MATAMAVSDRQLEVEMQQLHGEGTRIRKKIDEDTRALEAAHAERERIIDGIARGTVEESEAPVNKAAIEKLQLRIEGNNRLFRESRDRINSLGQEIARRQGAAAAAAREKEYAELVKQGEAAANKAFEQLTRLVTEDLASFDAIRQKLGWEFRDLGGEAVAVKLRERLFKYSGPNEAVHDPNIYLWKLFEQGWELLSKGPRKRNSVGEFETVPGGELMLTVCSLKRK